MKRLGLLAALLIVLAPLGAKGAVFLEETRAADFDGVTSGPVRFDDGTPTSALTYTFVSLGDGGDDVGFQDVGPGYAYTPSTPYDGAVPAIQINRKGTLPASGGGGDPYFEIRFRTRVR